MVTTTPTLAAASTGGGSGDETSQSMRLWLNGADTPDEMVERRHRASSTSSTRTSRWSSSASSGPASWSGSPPRCRTDDSPDIVELGNTQAQAFEAAGALRRPDRRADDARRRRPARRAWSRRAPTTARSTACRTTRAPASSCTARTCSRPPASRCRRRSRSSSTPASPCRQANAGDAELLRASTSPAATGTPCAAVHLGRRRRHRRPGGRRVGRPARLAPSRSRASRRCSRS